MGKRGALGNAPWRRIRRRCLPHCLGRTRVLPTLGSVYQSPSPAISFELFPPKTAQGDAALMAHAEALMQFAPAYFTCTYGAGGSTRRKTLEIVDKVKRQFGVPVASHLTCVGSTVDELRDYLLDAKNRNVDYIVALRGDPPRGENEFRPVAGGFRHANELTAMIHQEFPNFGIAVAGYPEVHQEAPSPEADLANLKRKVDSGADVVITQLFYCNDDFFRFRDKYEAAGIQAPLIPGVLPITSFGQIQRITELCGARLPVELCQQFETSDEANEQEEMGTRFATQQVAELLEAGVPGIHFYVLNRSKATCRVLEGLRQKMG